MANQQVSGFTNFLNAEYELMTLRTKKKIAHETGKTSHRFYENDLFIIPFLGITGVICGVLLGVSIGGIIK